MSRRTLWQPTRAAALTRMAEFAPQMGRAYADRRNVDDWRHGDGGWPGGVSALSPWVRHRLLHEAELIEAANPRGNGAAKFVSEVLWRTYFKGWLEQRPGVWANYVTGRDAALELRDSNGGVARDYAAAVEGRTGIDCFDAWAKELVVQNWLHNHARMWFASIWIFTLRLPWELGADFFLTHLLDGDAASNTLSWRWVAGIHTPGKHYLARADNIRRYTNGAFDPKRLNERAEPLPMDDVPPAMGIGPADAAPSGDYRLLLHADDGDWTRIGLTHAPVDVIGWTPEGTRAPAVSRFAEAAVADSVSRAGAAFAVPFRLHDGPLSALDDGPPLVTPWLPTGWLNDAAQDAPLIRLRGAYDSALWPLGTAGFFKVKAGAEKALHPLGLTLPPL